MTSRTHCFCLGGCLLFALSSMSVAQDDGRYPTPEQSPAFCKPVFITKPLDRAYPGAEYNTRPAVTGGTWPYRFALRAAPDGMTIDEKTGAMVWRAPVAETTASVTVTVTDQAGRKAEQSFSIAVGKSGFVFVSPDGDDANPGTFEKPWKTVMRAAQSVPESANTTLYLRGGTYAVETPAEAGKKNANVLKITRTSPRRWVAWPGEKPAIDLGWSAEQWKAALEVERAKLDEKNKGNATTQSYGHRIFLDQQTDDLLFDGIEVKNAAYYMFVMWDGNRSRLTWRRCHLHHLYGDYAENSSFIFGFAAERKWQGESGEKGGFGVRPLVKPYCNIVVQDCIISDRPYHNLREGAWHGGGLVWYTTQGCLVEDCRFERIERGMAILDKDNGWDNTYRNNIIRGNVMLAAQGCADGILIHHNWIDGDVHLGSQPGWLRNVWLHHNAIRGGVSLMGGATRGPGRLDPAGKKMAGPTDPDSLAAIREMPRERRVIFAWGNIVDMPERRPGGEKPIFQRVSADADFADRYRHVWWDANLVDETAELAVGWGGKHVKWSDMKACGFDVNGASGAVVLDDEGHLPASSPWRATYGRDAGLTPQKP
jgi:hypothetical protein